MWSRTISRAFSGCDALVKVVAGFNHYDGCIDGAGADASGSGDFAFFLNAEFLSRHLRTLSRTLMHRKERQPLEQQTLILYL